MIKIQNLAFVYPSSVEAQNRVLDNISLTIRDGEAVGIMGANGSGKTTLARCLNGLLLPTAGDVWVDDLNTKDPANLRQIRRRVGMMFQNPENQIVSTTVEREIAFGLENLGMPHDEMHRIVDDMLVQFDLVRYRQHPPHLLSGGEMQRLALAAVMAMSPQYLIFDEPTSLLDPAARKMVLRLIHDLHVKNQGRAERVTTILITQFPEEALSCDRLLILQRGRIVFDDRPSAIFQHVDELKRLGVDVPAEYEIDHFLKHLSNGNFAFNPVDFLPIL
jgi:energy-coupling factor transport system ATP-binding protein